MLLKLIYYKVKQLFCQNLTNKQKSVIFSYISLQISLIRAKHGAHCLQKFQKGIKIYNLSLIDYNRVYMLRVPQYLLNK